jgi:ELWxxDGT repeat protein
MISFSSIVQARSIEPQIHSDIKLVVRDSTYDFVEHNGLVYTIADDGVHGIELWVFDENLNSLRMVKDINPIGDANPLVFSSVLENVLLFYAYDENGTGLWATDGTEVGTVLLKYFYFYEIKANIMDPKWNLFKTYKGELYFNGIESKDKTYELWKTDGTAEGTILVKELNPNGSSSPGQFHIREDKLLFQTYNGFRDIWATDGTEESTINLTNSKDKLRPVSIIGWNSTHDFFLDSLDGKLELWSTDGTISGTLPLSINLDEIIELNSNMIFIDKNLYFESFTEDGSIVLNISDGTQAGTRKLKTITSEPDAGIFFISYYNTGEQKLFFYTYENKKNSLWVSDGTEQGTIKISPPELVNINRNKESLNTDKLFFSSFGVDKGDELWVSDGTQLGTHFVKKLSDGGNSSRIEFTSDVIDDKVLFYYKADNGVGSTWITDGTETSTYILNPNLMFISRMYFSDNQFNNILFFTEVSSADTTRMWQTNMTLAGTSVIMPQNQSNNKHINPYLFYQIEFKNHIYFLADYYGEGQQLYRIPNTISSVEESKLPELMAVYPNPAKDFIQLEISKPMQLSIINSTGKVVKDYGLVTVGKLNVAALISGVYFVVDEQGNNIAKFVKE